MVRQPPSGRAPHHLRLFNRTNSPVDRNTPYPRFFEE